MLFTFGAAALLGTLTARAQDGVVATPWPADETPQVSGALSPDQIELGLQASSGAVEACYRAVLAQASARAGPVEATFVVGVDGVPTAMQTSGEAFPEAWFHGCLVGALSAARFPAAAAPTAVSWTLPVDQSVLTVPSVGGLIGTKAAASGPTANANATATVGDAPVILGALDKSLIDAVIKRNMNQIRYCYQRELTKNPGLAGKVTVKFVIAKDGSVSSAVTKTTTLNNARVEDCLNGRFMRFQFPEPKGGGIVIVSYPFVFEPG